MTNSLFGETVSTARFSPCRKYRYTLTRIWDKQLPLLNFCMLNPSKADEYIGDPTVDRCLRRTRMWNYGGLIVTNLFAWRSTDPAELKRVVDPIGPGNDEAIVEMAERAQLIICAWGKDGELFGRGDAVRKRLHSFATLHYLKLSEKTGQPHHPLYLKYSLKPQVWNLTGEANCR